jgi:hypothetical protein
MEFFANNPLEVFPEGSQAQVREAKVATRGSRNQYDFPTESAVFRNSMGFLNFL